jgi:hypothetical protein
MEKNGFVYDGRQMVTYLCLVAGISKKELAHRIGMTQQGFDYRLKNGKFSIDEWQKIAIALNRPIQLNFVPSNNTNEKIGVAVLANGELV